MMFRIVFVFIFCNVLVFSQSNKSEIEKAISDLSNNNYEIRVKAKAFLEKIGSRALPYLCKSIDSSDLEVKDFAEQQVNSLIKYTNKDFLPEALLKSDANSVYYQMYLESYYNRLQKYFLSIYELAPESDKQMEEKIKNLISINQDYFKKFDIDNLISDNISVNKSSFKFENEYRIILNELSAKNCNNSLYKYLKNYFYYNVNDFRFNLEEFKQCIDQLTANNTNVYFTFQYLNIERNYKNKNPANRKEVAALTPRIMDALIELGKDDLLKDPIIQRRFMRWSSYYIETFTHAELEKYLPQFEKNFGEKSWIVNLIKSDYYSKKAWAIRGGGYANSVGEDSWKPFHENMALAEEHAIAAYKIFPKFPEAAERMISLVMAHPSSDRIRIWFERATAAEIDSRKAMQNYVWAILPRWGGSSQEILSLGREYLMLNDSRFNTAKFYFDTMNHLKREQKNIFSMNGITEELEWAMEQINSQKSNYGYLYNNDLAMAYFNAKDFSKCNKAIKAMNGMFATSWHENYEPSSLFIERFAQIGDKYKGKKFVNSMCEIYFDKKNIGENSKIILESLNSDVLIEDRPMVVYLLVRCCNANIQYLDEMAILALIQYGYKEVVWVTYLQLSDVNISENLKSKLIATFNNKILLAADVARKVDSGDLEARNAMLSKIKEIYLTDNADEKELEKNVDFQMSALRAILFSVKDVKEKQKYREVFSPYLKKMIEYGKGGEFIATSINVYSNESIKEGLCDSYKGYCFHPNDTNIPLIDQESKRLSAITEDKKLWEEVQIIWSNKGKPVYLLEFIELLKNRKMVLEAEILKQWVVYCSESYHLVNRDEMLIQTFSFMPGYHKEAFQLGLRASRANQCSVMTYLCAYHAALLGNYYVAYSLVTQAQTFKDHGDAFYVNKKRYQKSEDFQKYIIDMMLEAKDLPEVLRFILKDQFDVKFKK